jgi:hypothetical protein
MSRIDLSRSCRIKVEDISHLTQGLAKGEHENKCKRDGGIKIM